VSGSVPPVQSHLDLPFVFGTLRHPSLRAFGVMTRGAYRLSRPMQRARVQFARTGCPAHGGLPESPAHTLERRSTMAFRPEYTPRGDPHERARGIRGDIIPNAKLPWAPAKRADGEAA